MLTVLTHLLHMFWKCVKCFWVCCRLFFQSRSVVLDCGHTLGQHAQCLITPATHIQHFMFFWVIADACPNNAISSTQVSQELWAHMTNWPVPFSSISSLTLTSLTAPAFLHSSVMYAPWSTLVNYAFHFITIHSDVLGPMTCSVITHLLHWSKWSCCLGSWLLAPLPPMHSGLHNRTSMLAHDTGV